MTTNTREITAASLSVSHDPGHGGRHHHYKIDRRRGGYEVSATVSRHFPGPGERSFQPRTMTQVLPKDDREVADFLAKLALEHKVFELEGRACPHVFLHPTFYRFSFTDSEGSSHVFEYSIEAGRHHDDTYRGVVEELEQFFEAGRVARGFDEGELRLPEPPGRGKRLRRKFWYLASLFYRR